MQHKNIGTKIEYNYNIAIQDMRMHII